MLEHDGNFVEAMPSPSFTSSTDFFLFIFVELTVDPEYIFNCSSGNIFALSARQPNLGGGTVGIKYMHRNSYCCREVCPKGNLQIYKEKR
ncbi:rCG37799, partial [Rattus norvegicus]